MDKHIFKEQDENDMNDRERKLIHKVEELAKRLLGEDFSDFADFMNMDVLKITCSRCKTTIEINDVDEDSLLEVVFPRLIARLLNYYDLNERPKAILEALKMCKDGKEELCQNKD